MSDKTMHSTGRGGAGNIGQDPNTYVDGDIVREGVVGQPSHAGGHDYSAGRGGAGNIVVPSPRASPAPPQTGAAPPPEGPSHEVSGESEEVIPEPSMRTGYADFHTGRGGEGNIHRDKFGGHSKPQKEGKEGLMEKAKLAVGLGGKKEGS